jgi:hypothetical protein
VVWSFTSACNDPISSVKRNMTNITNNWSGQSCLFSKLKNETADPSRMEQQAILETQQWKCWKNPLVITFLEFVLQRYPNLLSPDFYLWKYVYIESVGKMAHYNNGNG